MNNYLVYKHTSPSGKSYIGQTNNLVNRNSKHQHSSSKCRYFYNAIQKYGWNNFTHIIIESNLSLDLANELEEFLIQEGNTLYPNGYNLKTGSTNGKHSEETIQKITTNNARRGGHLTNDQKQKMKEGRLASNYTRLGFKQTEETKQKIREIRTGTKRTEETKKKISENSARRGKPAYNRGIPHSKEHQDKLNIARRNRPKLPPAPIVICPHCGKEGHQGNMMNRWHFDNCKLIGSF